MLTVSGGQKARVALARAVYSYTQHLLLDDPLAAVDSHTAKHLTDNCLNGPLMKGRTVVSDLRGTPKAADMKILVSHHPFFHSLGHRQRLVTYYRGFT